MATGSTAVSWQATVVKDRLTGAIESFRRCLPQALAVLERDSGLLAYRELSGPAGPERLTQALMLQGQRYLATQSLRMIQAKLEGGSFRRVHRNALVNVDHVRKLAALSSNRSSA